MSRIPTITLWAGKDYVIVEPGSLADKLFRSKGYADKQPENQVKKEISEEIPTATLFPAKKKGRPKKVKDIGKTDYKKTEGIT